MAVNMIAAPIITPFEIILTESSMLKATSRLFEVML